VQFEVGGRKVNDEGPASRIVFEMTVYMLDPKHMMIMLEGELNHLSMTIKIYQDQENGERDKVFQKMVKFVRENKEKEFSWKSVQPIVEDLLHTIVRENKQYKMQDYELELIAKNDEQHLSDTHGILQYAINHIPKEDEDQDEALSINFDFFMYKDEFMPSLYMNIDSDVYQSEFLIPFMGNIGGFKAFIEKSINEIFHKIRTITMNLSYMHEQPQIKTPKTEVIEYIKDEISKLEGNFEEDKFKVEDIYEGTYKQKRQEDKQYLEQKVYYEPSKYFLIHDIIMEEKRPGYLVKCFNLFHRDGSVGEYRIYETNYYPWKKDFKGFVKDCLTS
jgi:hypothetical protein